ncbi:Crp/Fnr family transcriptional regulator [Taibaiella chishuiensis]|uniref:CRP-like cAMP-binding protein n=1 Tax=Taibaiella chishuiensis TaxID=1434707 RepID=A0A2P8DAN0_9BACT|nr:Crp/Fnr family transcriptional regulator [Taibaiella chishuiensis]PSK94265.1 CRP-like cAMP-binding protein [Taibaiella chishuiensis]
MLELLFAEIAKEVELTAADKALVQAAITPRKLRKRQYLMQHGEHFGEIAFVNKGMLRACLKGEKGAEHVMQFAPEGTWIPDSFNLSEDDTALYDIDALENAEVLLIDREVFQQLLQRVPALEKYFRQVMQKRLNALHLRVINYLTHFAEDKYKMFVETYPEIVQRVPQHMIASYLGIKPETLSRNRKKMATRKKEEPEL